MYSYVCVLSTNNYLEGVLVLNENLKQLKSKYPLLCLINEFISEETRQILTKFHIKYKLQKAILPSSITDSARWKYTFDKLNVFNLTEYEKIVYLDSDFLILENLDYLFEIDDFTMVYDNKRENYHCSALMVIKPKEEDYLGLLKLTEEVNKTNTQIIGDQDIINIYFDNIKVLPIQYNFIKGIEDTQVEVYDYVKQEKVTKHKCKDFYYSDDPKIIHYYELPKPFMLTKEFDDMYCHLYFYYLEIIRKQKDNL